MLRVPNLFFETKHPADSGLRYHCHELPYVTLVLEGAYIEVSNDVPKRCHPGSLIVHSPGEEHADRFEAPVHCLNAVLLDADFVSTAQQLIHACRSVTHSVARAAIANLDALTARLPSTEKPRWLEEIVELPEWTDAVPLNGFAKRCGVHPTHFSREFHRYMGATPSAHRRRKRVELASHLLLASNRSLAHVAVACGLTDQSHLNRAFALELGISPGTFRKAFTR